MVTVKRLLLTPDEAAESLLISKSYLYELKSRDRIPYVKVGANLRFRPDDLEEYVEHHKEETDAGDHHDPNTIELWCDQHPEEPECLIYDD